MFQRSPAHRGIIVGGGGGGAPISFNGGGATSPQRTGADLYSVLAILWREGLYSLCAKIIYNSNLTSTGPLNNNNINNNNVLKKFDACRAITED